jgi:hypothetical protein
VTKRSEVCHRIQAEVRKLRVDRPTELLRVLDDHRLGDRDGLAYKRQVGPTGVLQKD